MSLSGESERAFSSTAEDECGFPLVEDECVLLPVVDGRSFISSDSDKGGLSAPPLVCRLLIRIRLV